MKKENETGRELIDEWCEEDGSDDVFDEYDVEDYYKQFINLDYF